MPIDKIWGILNLSGIHTCHIIYIYIYMKTFLIRVILFSVFDVRLFFFSPTAPTN